MRVLTTGTGDQISFMAEWQNALYQANDRESFCFPAAWLVKPAEEVAETLVAQRKEAHEKAKKAQDEYLTNKRREDYLKLKAEFEA